MISRRHFVRAGLATVVGCGLYARFVEPHWVAVVRRPMPLVGLPPHLVGRTLLQISDLHVGPTVDSDYLVATLRHAASLTPDIVAITGDFVTYRTPAQFTELARVLAHLPHGRLATVGSLGNHDYGAAWSQLDVADAVTRVATEAGITMLRNARHEASGLQFAGLADLWSPEFHGIAGAHATLTALDRAAPTVVLSHNPDSLDLPIWGEMRGWVLSGHTHGGQCKPPFLPPPVLPVRNRRYTAGTFDIADGRTLYINRGLGYTLPVRFDVRPELTLFTLSAA